jgi:hypothetical protein
MWLYRHSFYRCKLGVGGGGGGAAVAIFNINTAFQIVKRVTNGFRYALAERGRGGGAGGQTDPPSVGLLFACTIAAHLVQLLPHRSVVVSALYGIIILCLVFSYIVLLYCHL